MGNWKVGLCSVGGCLNDWKLCAISWLFPIHTFGMAAEKALDKGDGVRCITLSAIPIINYCVLPCWRSNIRASKGVDGNFCFDLLAAYCCLCCTVFQGGVEAGLDGGDEIKALYEKVKKAVKGFDPKKEAKKAKDDTKHAAENPKDAVAGEMERS